MLTLTQIKESAEDIRTGADLPSFVQQLKEGGVIRIDIYVVDGMAAFFWRNGDAMQTSSAYPNIDINNDDCAMALLRSIQTHQKGLFDFRTFCYEAANAGVEKWVINLDDMEVNYFNSCGSIILQEEIPCYN